MRALALLALALAGCSESAAPPGPPSAGEAAALADAEAMLAERAPASDE